jgi:hypothetical protein
MSRLPALLRRDRGLLVLLLLLLAGLPLVTTRIYASDEIKYFAHLHSVTFDGDLDFSNDYQHWVDQGPKYAPIKTLLKTNPTTGMVINEAPVGTALLWSPAFGLAHLGVLAARALGVRVAADGYSQPYISAVCYASYLYGWLGLLLIYRLLRRLVEPFLAVLAVLTVWLGTSAFFYMIIAPPWSHAASLFTVALFTSAWFFTRRPTGRRPREWVLLGFCAGLMMLVREQDALFLALPAVETLFVLWSVVRGLWPVSRRSGVGGREADDEENTQHATRNTQHAIRNWIVGWLLLGVTASITFIPQLIAYKVLGGRWGPSSTVGDKLDWLSPHALGVLFAPDYGLLPWAPVIVVALFGLLALARKDRELAVALLVAFIAQVYIAGAFSTWQGKSSFGQRRFVNCTALFAVGLAAAAGWAQGRGLRRPVLAALAVLAVAWEGGLAVQYALWTSDQRQAGLPWPQILGDQASLPFRLPGIAWRFLTDRKSFFQGGS